MTEQEWLECADPKPMLGYLEGKGSDRKLRLFAVACCRQVWHLLSDERSRNAVEFGEQFADGLAIDDERVVVHSKADIGGDYFDAEAGIDPRFGIVVVTQDAVADPEKVRFGLEGWRWAAGMLCPRTEDYDSLLASETLEFVRLCDCLRCIFGNPFRPITVDPVWLTPTVVSLATAIYDERAFDRLPILADALEDAGCDNADILNHCRQPGEHVRGCWAVDLVLGKS